MCAMDILQIIRICMDGNKNNIPEKYDETEPKFFPPELWGLSFQFNMFCKLYVTDILQLRPYPMYPGKLVTFVA